MRNYRRYPEYKNSGIEWLGKIPAHWEIRRLKNVVTLWNEKVLSIDLGKPYIGMENVESWTGKILDTDLEVTGTANTFEAGHVLFGKLRPYLAKAIFTHMAGQCSSEFLVMKPNAVSGRFLHLLVLSDGFVRTVDSATYGTKMPRANWETVSGIGVAIPKISEQRAIAGFLDHETAKIDALVEKKERLIELLQEKRTALITHAVTKGLDPNVPMKDSGIEWLGRIPKQWEVTSVKRISKRVQTGSTPPTNEIRYYENGVVPWYGPGSFGTDIRLARPVKYLHQDAVKEGAARFFEGGSTMIVTIGATVGKVGFIPEAGSCNQQITVVTFDSRRIIPTFAAYQLKRLEQVLRGIAPNTTLPIIDQQEIAMLPLAIPPSKEQQEIVTMLERKTSKIDALIAKIEEAIKLLKEYRIALISAAVTGKIDVRGSAEDLELETE